MPANYDDFKGRVKEAAGDLTNDKDLEREGKIDQVKGKIDEMVDDFTDKVKSLLD